MASLEVFKEAKSKGEQEGCTRDGSVDLHGRPALRERTGKWFAGVVILLNQVWLAFFRCWSEFGAVLTRVLQQDNAGAANSVSKWTGTVYIFSLVGAFLSDSYWEDTTCAIFQVIFVIGLALLSLATQISLLKPRGCGRGTSPCKPHSSWEIGLFYLSIYMVALGNGGYQPNIATFGADQFDQEDPKEGRSKVSFFSYFYLALNLGSLFSNTILGYFEDEGMWALGFWASTASAFAALLLFLGGTKSYRHFRPTGNPLSRFAQVLVAALNKWREKIPPGEHNLYEAGADHGSDHTANGGARKMLHTQGFKFLDRAAFLTSRDSEQLKQNAYNPWRLCPISQVEEVKCILRLLPIWLCTIIYSVVFTQMASLFVEQGDAMNTNVSNFRIPPASMSSFDILSVAFFIFLYRRVVDPLVRRVRKKGSLTELQRMGIGLIIAVAAMLSAGIVECYRLKYAKKDCRHCQGSSSLSIFWQVPQYALIGASEVFMYVGQLEFFNAQAPDGLKSFGSALCMTSISLGNYVSSFLVSIVMKISTVDNMPGWIPGNLNKGHLDRFYFLLAGLTAVDLVIYIACARWYTSMKLEGNHGENNEEAGYGV
ncbi:UNVERIFIED_CONTAM: protein NRT1/ PTR FAMILY 7.3 [Sesamum calycinum]|uniref:Protein NRT1/ PTR FAMILY 7.3 n=2 Tax=Sesamum TaxID=4181 RepID=A0AAW2LZ17_9LAMI